MTGLEGKKRWTDFLSFANCLTSCLFKHSIPTLFILFTLTFSNPSFQPTIHQADKMMRTTPITRAYPHRMLCGQRLDNNLVSIISRSCSERDSRNRKQSGIRNCSQKEGKTRVERTANLLKESIDQHKVAVIDVNLQREYRLCIWLRKLW